MNCFHAPCPNKVAYTFHSGGLCVVHASDARQNAPSLVLTPFDDEPTDPTYDPNAMHPTRPVGSVYPDDKVHPDDE